MCVCMLCSFAHCENTQLFISINLYLTKTGMRGLNTKLERGFFCSKITNSRRAAKVSWLGKENFN